MKLLKPLNKNTVILYGHQTIEEAINVFLSNYALSAIPIINSNNQFINLITASDLLRAVINNKGLKTNLVNLEKQDFDIIDENTLTNNLENFSDTFAIILDKNKNIRSIFTPKDYELYKLINKNKELSVLNDIFESSYDGIYITDGEANTIRINKSYERITGMNREDMLGINMSELVKRGFISESGTLQLIEKDETITLTQTFKSGRKGLITSSPVKDSDGNIVMVVTNVRDITELSELKDKLEENKELTEKYYSEIKILKAQFIKTPGLTAEDPKTLDVLRLAMKVSKVESSILILGESGVGKEEVAKFIHKNSNREFDPFIKINCGAIPKNLIESELFGYEKGAFTSANNKGKKGLFEVANNGTLFLDELGELPLDLQVKLLRVLQEQEITRIGGLTPIKINVRIISASNRNLEEMVKAKLFRKDLFYRLNVVPIYIPPLRERKQDILPLVSHFLSNINNKYTWTKSFTNDALDALYLYEWPGNIRELSNIVERAAVTSTNNLITRDDLPIDMSRFLSTNTFNFNNNQISLEEAVNMVEKKMLSSAFKKHGNVRDAAKALGISPATFVRKRKKYLQNDVS